MKRTNPVDCFPIKVIPIPELTKLQKKTTYAQPVEIACFSYDAQRKIHKNRNSLSYYIEPKLPLDLNVGYPDKYVIRDSTPERLNALFEVLADVKDRGQFCTWRGIMTKIICTPYCQRDEWELGATLYNGTIYLEEHETQERQQSKFGRFEHDRIFTYYGYNYESLCTSSRPDFLDNYEGVNTNIQFCSIFKSKLGSNNIVLGGEVDCMLSKPESESSKDYQRQYVELKTHKKMSSPQQEKSFIKFKLLKTWAQSFLAGVQHVIFGFRTADGIVLETKQYMTNDFTRMARKEKMWDPHVCLTFGDLVLNTLKKVVIKDDINTVYTIRYIPENGQVEILQPNIGGEQVFVKN